MIKFKKLNENIIIENPMLLQKFNLATKAINDRLKKINQIQQEIVNYKIQLQKIEELTIKQQKAEIKTKGPDQNQQIQQNQQNQQNQINVGNVGINTNPNNNPNESKIPTYEEFLKEEHRINQEDLIDGQGTKSDKIKEGITENEDFILSVMEEEEDEEDEKDYAEEIEELAKKDENPFYLRINEEDPAIVKVYKEDEDDRWEMTVVEGYNTALNEMQFQSNWDKTEIMSYLADIYKDVEEIDEELFNNIIDDKKEIDHEFYE